MIQPASETAKAIKKAGGKSIRQAAEAEALKRGHTIDGDSSWSPKRRTAEEAAAEAKSRRTDDVGEVRAMPVELVRVTPGANPRSHFDQTALDELAASIESTGLAQPILVRPVDDGYELIAGERRLRAFRQLKRAFIPAHVRELTDAQVVEIRAMENLARADLNPIETATAYRQILDSTGESQAALAKRLGCSQPKVAHAVSLLRLPKVWQERIVAEKVTPFDCRELLAWVDRPAVMAAVEAEVKDAEKHNWTWRVGDVVWRAIDNATAPLSGWSHDGGFYGEWRIRTDKLPADVAAALDLVEVERHGRKEVRAGNLQLAEKLKADELDKARKRASKGEAKPSTKADATPEQREAAEKRRAEQLRQAVSQWRTNWLRGLVAEALTAHLARRLFLWSWASLSTGHGLGSLDESERRELLHEAAAIPPFDHRSYDDVGWFAATRKHKPNVDAATLTEGEPTLDAVEIAVARRLLVDDEGTPQPAIPPGIVEQLAAELKIDEDDCWRWTPEFCDLFRKGELLGLCKEAKAVLAEESMTKDAIVLELVEHGQRTRPKILVAIAKAARKGGRS